MIEQRENRTGAERGFGSVRSAALAESTVGEGGADRRSALPLNDGGRGVPPLLPVLLPIVIAAIVTGGLFAWWFPPAPGAVAPAAKFTDITVEAGLGGWAPRATADAPTTLGGGVVAFDYDGDGHVDLFFVGGAPWPWEETMGKQASRGSVALFRNDGAGEFTDVTAAAGLHVELQGMMAAAGDFDADGRPDLFVTCVGTNHLFRNLGRGRFEDVTESAGVGGADNTWSTGATWIDVDHDGRLDLVVAHYARWSREVELQMAFTVANVGHSYGAPTGFVGVFPSVYRNVGDGRFVSMPEGAGLRAVDPETGFPLAKALAVVPVDANGDGKLDLLFSYHTSDSVLFVNQGEGRFRQWRGGAGDRHEGGSAGLALASSLPLASADTDPRLAAFQWAMMAGGRGDEAFTALGTKLGVALLDYDLDGRLDIFSSNGRAEPNTNRFEQGREFGAAPQLRWNRGNGWILAPITDSAAGARTLTGRGVVAADFDGDGDLDVAMAQNGAGPRLWRNDQRVAAPWLQVELIAKHGVREAHGARVEVHTPRGVHVRTVAPATAYMAQSPATLTFGLGDDARVRKVVVHWPDGSRHETKPEAVNRRWVIAQP